MGERKRRRTLWRELQFDLRVSGFYKLSTICKPHAVIKVNFMKKLAPSLCFVVGGISLVQQEVARMDLTSSVSQVRKFEPYQDHQEVRVSDPGSPNPRIERNRSLS